MDLVRQIQSRLQEIYGIDLEEDARNYLIGRDDLLSLVPSALSTTPRELFLVNPNPNDGTLEVALYLDPGLKENLSRHDPRARLSDENISDFCALVEGVSHFVYYLHKAGLEHEVTELEMEIQAEVDKFVLLACLASSSEENRRRFLDVLFENYGLIGNLPEENRERYETANRLARRYCYGLLRDFRDGDLNGLVREARAFYPMRQGEKIRRILA